MSLVFEIDNVLFAFGASHQTNGFPFVKISVSECNFQVLQRYGDLGQLVGGIEYWCDLYLVVIGLLLFFF